MESSSGCLEQLAGGAAARSGELAAIAEQLALLEGRRERLGGRIDYARSRQWANFLTAEPVKLLQTLLGGGDYQRGELAIADLEAKQAQLQAQAAELYRRESEVVGHLKEEVLKLVLDWEAAARASSRLASQLHNQRLLSAAIEIDYRFGGSSTASYLTSLEKLERLEGQLLQSQLSGEEALRRLLVLTGFDPPSSEIVGAQQ